MKRLIVLAFLFFPSTAHAITFAQFAIGGGYESVILISNKTALPWSGRIYINSGYNLRWPVPWSINGQTFNNVDYVTFGLVAHETRKFRITGDATTRAGYLAIEADSGSSSLDVAVSYFYEYRSNGALQDTIGDSPSAWGDGFAVNIEKSATINTGLA